MGFTLDQVRDLLRLSSQGDQECREVDRIAAGHLAAVELRRINSRCAGGGVIATCRIIDALSPGEKLIANC